MKHSSVTDWCSSPGDARRSPRVTALAGPDGKLGVRELELRLVQSLDDIRQPQSDVDVQDI